MLDRESQSFDLQEVWLAQQTIEIDAQRMSRQLGDQTRTQTVKSMGMVVYITLSRPKLR
jgi:hypothetical protein